MLPRITQKHDHSEFVCFHVGPLRGNIQTSAADELKIQGTNVGNWSVLRVGEAPGPSLNTCPGNLHLILDYLVNFSNTTNALSAG